jgi:ATP-dependent DNA helicase RecG
MKVDIHDILRAAQVGETQEWEFKSARGGFPESFWETYSAFANTDGGTIVFGVTLKDGQVQLDGLEEGRVKAYHKALWDQAHNPNKVNINVLGPSSATTVECHGSWLLVVEVRRADRFERPVHLGRNPFGHTFKRRDEGDYRLRDHEVRRMIADADPIPQDRRILEHFGLDDIDKTSLDQYRQRMLAAKGPHPWLRLNDLDLLEMLGGWRRDRQSGQQGLTAAGLLMFGKFHAIRDPLALPLYHVDYREKLDPKTRWNDRVVPDGTWEANLFQFYQRVWPKLSAGLPNPFILEGPQRRDDTSTHEGLREAFVNALVHADYHVPGGIVIERLPDRFKFVNPGTLLVSMEQYRRGSVSQCRNEALQTMFQLMGSGDRAGSGVEKIYSGWADRHWRSPFLEVLSDPDRLSLTLPTTSLIPEHVLDFLRVTYGEERIGALNKLEVQALATAAIEGSVSNTRLQDLVSEHPSDIGRVLRHLCDEGFLYSDDRRRWATYYLTREIDPLWLDEEIDPTPPIKDPHPPIKDPDPQIKEPHPPIKDPHPPILEVLPRLLADDTLIDPGLLAIAEPVRNSGRAPSDLVEGTIIQLCRGRYLSLSQLSTLLDRKQESLRNAYVSRMVKSGQLRQRFPDQPGRRDQAYTSGT